jgi:MFS family permease
VTEALHKTGTTDRAVSAFVAMLAAQVLVAAAGLAPPVLATLAAPDVGLEPYLIGIWVSLMYAGAALAGPVSGGLIARWGAVRVSQATLLLSAAGLAVAAIGTPLAVVLSALVIGVGYGPTTPASSHILARTTPAARINLVFSLKQTGVPLGYALAGAILPSLGLLQGWRIAVLELALACLAVALAIQPLRRHLDDDLDPGRRLFSLALIVGPIRAVTSSPVLRLFALTSLTFAGIQTCLGTFLVTYLDHGLGMDVVAAGFALSLGQAAGVGGRILWGAVADRWSPTLVLGLLALGMTASSVLVALFTPSWPYAAICAVCMAYGGTAIAWNGVHLAQVARHAPPGRAGEVTGGTFFFTFGGVVIVPLAFSALLAATGSYTLGFVAVGATTLVSALALLLKKAGRPEAAP